ncbi:DoxX family protein [Psychroflexus sp. S27]|uniref:BT_3928 family protein n=1 Tax=Psychroflexus sp. S27 TaxID=1982757 RepID=UPI000C2AEB53|nr:BT_3928 family protein [Psychroflexus sp. S27]PJX23671.1 DoxX family protein [Psychroflexus sp. S27]
MQNKITQIARFLVGIVFIFSGLVKLNDPIGFGFKLEEYFSSGVLNLPFLEPYALLIAIFVVILEVLLGVALIIGYAKTVTKWTLVLMMIFFTFLTFYSAYFNKVTDCGCFGDAIPLTPWQSFYKDIILSFLIMIIFFNSRYIKPLFAKASLKWIVFVTTILCFYLGYHVLINLPVVDFRAYKTGVNIQEDMSIPEGAQEPVTLFQWEFIVDGEKNIYETNGAYPEVDGEFVNVTTEVIDEGYVPPIHDFTLMKNDQDKTEELLTEEKLLMIPAYNLSRSENQAWPAIKKVIDKAKAKNYRIIGVSASGNESISELEENYGIHLDFYVCDETTIKAIVRSNPGIVVIKNGVIQQKLHWQNADEF